jgi:hypothetical protein
MLVVQTVVVRNEKDFSDTQFFESREVLEAWAKREARMPGVKQVLVFFPAQSAYRHLTAQSIDAFGANGRVRHIRRAL